MCRLDSFWTLTEFRCTHVVVLCWVLLMFMTCLCRIWSKTWRVSWVAVLRMLWWHWCSDLKSMMHTNCVERWGWVVELSVKHDSVISFLSCFLYRLVGLVVIALASRAEDPGFDSVMRWDFSGLSHNYWWLKNWNSSGYPASAWHIRVSAGTGWPGISIL